MTTLAFVDTETTGLDPDRHQIWEVGLILADTEGNESDREHVWQLPVDLGRAESIALTIGGFYDRYRRRNDQWEGDLGAFAADFARLTHGAHLVGAVISFDEERLRKLLRAHGACPGWHYHLIDVEALAAGWLGHDGHTHPDGPACHQKLPWKSDELSIAVGVDPDDFERHTALGDAKWAKAIYDAVIGR